MDAPSRPLWSQEQAIAYEVALEAINDVIAGYSEQIALERARPTPNAARIAWLEMRTDQAVSGGVCGRGRNPTPSSPR